MITEAFKPAKVATSVSLSEGLQWKSGAGWIYEEKKDGIRAFLRFGLFETRSGNLIPLPDSLPAFFEDCVLDGELCNGFYWVFDVLCIRGEDLRSKSLKERKETLSLLSVGFPEWMRLIPSGANGGEYLEAVLRDGGEGVIAKALNAKYGQGWIKCKREETHDCVITEKHLETLSFSLGQFKDGKMIDCGRVALQFDQWQSSSVGQVVELKCHSRQKSGKFREPVFLRFRHDKPASECIA